MGRCDDCGKFIARCFRGIRCKRCARRRSEKRSNARAATKDETRGTNDAEAQPPHGEHTQGPLELEEGMSSRERTETNRDTAQRTQTADSDPANTLTEKESTSDEVTMRQGLTCEQALLEYIRSIQSYYILAGAKSDGSGIRAAEVNETNGFGRNIKTVPPPWIAANANTHDSCSKDEEGLFHGIQRQETIKCLQNWGFTSEQIAQYMSGGSDKTSRTIVLRESGRESSTSSEYTVDMSAGTTGDGPSVGNGSSIKDSFSIGPSIADHSSALNRSTPIFATTNMETQRDENDKNVVSWVTQRHQSMEARDGFTTDVHKRSIIAEEGKEREEGEEKMNNSGGCMGDSQNIDQDNGPNGDKNYGRNGDHKGFVNNFENTDQSEKIVRGNEENTTGKYDGSFFFEEAVGNMLCNLNTTRSCYTDAVQPDGPSLLDRTPHPLPDRAPPHINHSYGPAHSEGVSNPDVHSHTDGHATNTIDENTVAASQVGMENYKDGSHECISSGTEEMTVGKMAPQESASSIINDSHKTINVMDERKVETLTVDSISDTVQAGTVGAIETGVTQLGCMGDDDSSTDDGKTALCAETETNAESIYEATDSDDNKTPIVCENNKMVSSDEHNEGKGTLFNSSLLLRVLVGI